jgi:hypothetical protein
VKSDSLLGSYPHVNNEPTQRAMRFLISQIEGLPADKLSAMRALCGVPWMANESQDFEMALFALGHPTLKQAAKQYKKTLKWREEMGADEIRAVVRRDLPHSMFPSNGAIQQSWPHNLCSLGSFTRDGNPIGVSRTGLADLARLQSSVKLEHFQTHMIYVAEARLWQMEKIAVRIPAPKA